MPDIDLGSATHRQQQRGVTTLLVSTFLSWSGFLLLVPLISVHYVDDLGWTASLSGIMLAVRQFSQQGFGPNFGVLRDRTGPKPLIVVGQLLRAVGFGALAFVDSISGVLLAMILAALTPPADRRRRYAPVGDIGALCVTLGNQICAVLIRQDIGTIALIGGET